MNGNSEYSKRKFKTVSVFLKKHYKPIISAVILLLVFAGYFLGYSKNSETYFFSSLEKSIMNKDAKKLASFITVDGKSVLKEDAEPLLEYLLKENNKDSFIKSIEESGKYNGFTLKKKRGIFTDKFWLECTGIQIKINTSYPSRILINNKEAGITKENEGLTVKGKLPGLYVIKAAAESPYGNIEGMESIPVLKDQEMSIELQGNPITIINTPYEDGRVYINNEDTGKKVSEIKNYGFFPKDDSNKLFFVYDFPWGEIKSEEIAVGSLPEISPKIQMVNEKLEADIEESVKTFYTSVFYSLNKEDMNEIKNVPENIRFSIYSDMTKKYFILKNMYEIDNISCETEKDSFSFDEKTYKGKVKVDIDYTTSKKVFGIPVSVEKQKTSFLTDCEYNGSDWVITWVNKN